MAQRLGDFLNHLGGSDPKLRIVVGVAVKHFQRNPPEDAEIVAMIDWAIQAMTLVRDGAVTPVTVDAVADEIHPHQHAESETGNVPFELNETAIDAIAYAMATGDEQMVDC